jgi:hypothetical protein
MAKGKRGLDRRHRDKTGRIDRKHGNTKVAALRKEYGPGFAKGRRRDLMLKNLLRNQLLIAARVFAASSQVTAHRLRR